MNELRPVTTTCPQFDLLVQTLEANGYTVDIAFVGNYRTEPVYRFAKVKGKNIRAGFCVPNNGESYRYIDGKIAADHEEAFNKWSHCPLVAHLPNTEAEASKIVEYLAWLGTDEGYQWSNSFAYLDDPKLPRVE